MSDPKVRALYYLALIDDIYGRLLANPKDYKAIVEIVTLNIMADQIPIYRDSVLSLMCKRLRGEL